MNNMENLTVCPFTIIIDTREQLPLDFEIIGVNKKIAIPQKFKGLESGDYSIEGMEDSIAIERKSLEDLYSTLGQDRDRFKREIIRLNEMDFSAVVIEATLQNIYDPLECRYKWRSKLSPQSVLGTIADWKIRYRNVNWFFCCNRKYAALMIFSLLEKYYKHNDTI